MNCTVRELILLVSNKEFFLTRGIPHFHCIQRKFRTVHIIEKEGEEKEEGGDLVWFRLDHAQFTVHIIAGPSKYFTDQVFTLMSSRQQGKSKNNFRPPALWLWWPRSFISSACRHLFFFWRTSPSSCSSSVVGGRILAVVIFKWAIKMRPRLHQISPSSISFLELELELELTCWPYCGYQNTIE